MQGIKFKVWSKVEECWISIDNIVLDSNGSIAYLVPEADEPPYLEDEVEIVISRGGLTCERLSSERGCED